MSEDTLSSRTSTLRVFVISIALFAIALATIFFLSFIYLIEPGPEGRLRYMASGGKLLLHKYDIVKTLSTAETRRLYRSTCTKACHSRDVIELSPRTALEWEQIVARMKIENKAGFSETQARTITEYLQLNFLSNVPTVLPDSTMRFLKKHLWRLDFGESDLYFDIIYLPPEHRNLMPYLAFRSQPTYSDEALFIVYVNTHTGILPRWSMADIASIRINADHEIKASGWRVIHEDGQQHHKQGILTFPAVATTSGMLEMIIRPPAMRERVFSWHLPIAVAELVMDTDGKNEERTLETSSITQKEKP